MSREIEIQNALMHLGSRGVETFAATVIEVQKEKGTCTVNDGDLEYTDVQLSAVIDEDDHKFLVFPQENSTVLVSPIAEDIHRLYVEVVSKVESISCNIGESQFLVNENGYDISRKGENLKEVLNDFITQFGSLCEELSKVVVSVGVTPNIPNIATIKKEVTESIKQRLNSILIAEKK